jgi:hypothetical protein
MSEKVEKLKFADLSADDKEDVLRELYNLFVSDYIEYERYGFNVDYENNKLYAEEYDYEGELIRTIEMTIS